MGPNTKMLTKRDIALIWKPFDSTFKNKQIKIKKFRIGWKMIELCQLLSRLKSGIWPILGLKLAILARFFEISTSNLFCQVFTLRLIGKTSKKSIGPKITIKPPKSHINGHISILVFSKESVTKRLITSATINIFPWFFLQLLED